MINIVILILIIIALLIYAIGSCYLLISISRSKISEKENDAVNCILDILYQEWRCKYGTRR